MLVPKNTMSRVNGRTGILHSLVTYSVPQNANEIVFDVSALVYAPLAVSAC